jgi:hypothetical protein
LRHASGAGGGGREGWQSGSLLGKGGGWPVGSRQPDAYVMHGGAGKVSACIRYMGGWIGACWWGQVFELARVRFAAHIRCRCVGRVGLCFGFILEGGGVDTLFV